MQGLIGLYWYHLYKNKKTALGLIQDGFRLSQDQFFRYICTGHRLQVNGSLLCAGDTSTINVPAYVRLLSRSGKDIISLIKYYNIRISNKIIIMIAPIDK